jgi:hypothetical protein
MRELRAEATRSRLSPPGFVARDLQVDPARLRPSSRSRHRSEQQVTGDMQPSQSAAAPAVTITMQPPPADRVDWFGRIVSLLTLFINWLTVLVLAVGLYFAWDQAKKLTESIEANNNSINLASIANLGNQSLEVDKMFIKNPEYMKYFFNNVSIKNDNPNYEKATAVALFMLDYFDTARSVSQYTSNVLPNSLNDTNSWDAYFLATFRSSPLLCKVYIDNIDTYGTTLRELAEPVCSSQRPR